MEILAAIRGEGLFAEEKAGTDDAAGLRDKVVIAVA